MKPTPETDAARQKAWDFTTEWINPELCEKLERQRDEAREALREAAHILGIYITNEKRSPLLQRGSKMKSLNAWGADALATARRILNQTNL